MNVQRQNTSYNGWYRYLWQCCFTGIKEIRIFSRDEKKQDDMRKEYADSKLKFYIGNVRDSSSLQDAMTGVNFMFHAAALKQVPSCEFFHLTYQGMAGSLYAINAIAYRT